MTLCYLGIGANLGAPRATVQLALAALGRLAQCRLLRSSACYASAPVDAGGDDYVNAVVALETDLPAEQLLDQIQALELAFGRQRPYHNAPRTLDIDILLFGECHIDSARLSVPHPRLCERAFVLLPLLELAPDRQIPGPGRAADFLGAVAHQRIQVLS